MSLAPIALFVYARPDHTRRVLEALASARLSLESKLIVFSDGPKNADKLKNVLEVRRLIKDIKGFSSIEIRESKTNQGLSLSIIGGVRDICEEYGKVIVIEDDLVVSPCFLEYMNENLDRYENDDRVVSIHGYIYPVKERLPDYFFLKGADCWGWATWKRGWAIFSEDTRYLLTQIKKQHLQHDFDFNGTYPYTRMLKKQAMGKIDSWAIRWYASAFLREKLTLYPGKSMVHNIGNDLSGTHSHATDKFDVVLSDSKPQMDEIPVEENISAKNTIARYFKKYHINYMTMSIKKIIRKISG